MKFGKLLESVSADSIGSGSQVLLSYKQLKKALRAIAAEEEARAQAIQGAPDYNEHHAMCILHQSARTTQHLCMTGREKKSREAHSCACPASL